MSNFDKKELEETHNVTPFKGRFEDYFLVNDDFMVCKECGANTLSPMIQGSDKTELVHKLGKITNNGGFFVGSEREAKLCICIHPRWVANPFLGDKSIMLEGETEGEVYLVECSFADSPFYKTEGTPYISEVRGHEIKDHVSSHWQVPWNVANTMLKYLRWDPGANQFAPR